MEQIMYFISTYSEYITLVMLALFFLALLLFIVVINKLNKIRKQYKNLLKGVDKENLEEIILSNANKISSLEEEIKNNKIFINKVENDLSKCVKNIKLKRYNAFDGVGGEQSFSVAILDDNGTGVVVSSIHGREDARTYAKMVYEGKSKYHLSEEEKQVIIESINS